MFETFEQSLIYVSGLISSTGRKNCEALGRFLNKSGDSLLRILNDAPITATELTFLANQFFHNEPLYLIIDDTLIEKMYSRLIEGTSDNYDSSNHSMYRSLCSVVAMVTNGQWALPVDHRLWVSKEFIQSAAYATKTDLAKELIRLATQTIKIKCVVLDGLYATAHLISWLNENNINFEMRFHSNRMITIGDKKVAIKDFFVSRINGKKTCRTVKGSWSGIPNLYFTAVKRENKRGEIQIVYQVSNYKAEPRQHVRTYSYRWNIEKFFRTAKQKLGLKDCQSRNRQMQNNHIMDVFLAYTFLISECREKCLKKPEEALRRRKGKNSRLSIKQFIRPDQIFGVVYA